MRNAAIVVWLVCLGAVGGSATGDTWCYPTEPYELSSHDGRHQLRITPACGKQLIRPHWHRWRGGCSGGRFGTSRSWRRIRRNTIVEVFSVDSGDGARVSRFVLPKYALPYQYRVSPDGRAIVTLDSIGAVGGGDRVVAIYRDGRQVSEYALWQLLGMNGAEDLWNVRLSTEGLPFPASSSSWWWREHAFDFIDAVDGRPVFCIWLPYAPH